jgi:hypothetical protein
LAYIRKSDNIPTQRALGIINHPERDPICPVKLFNPAFRFWLAAYDPETQLAWGGLR